MIKITKGKEPSEWRKVRNTPGISFENAPKDALRISLLEEQGGLCAYCMRRVSFTRGESTATRIEHLKPRSLSIKEGKEEETLAYGNMVLCCDGDIGRNEEYHCDRSKGDSTIHFNPFDHAVIDTISYSSKNGTIKSTNPVFDRDFNEILRLNHSRLEKNRLAVLKGLIIEIGRRKWRKKDIADRLSYYSGRTSNGQFHEYCGVIVWYLNKKLRQFG